MIESAARSERVDRYVRGELDEDQSAAFEIELLESPALQDALEVALGLQRVAGAGAEPVSAEVLPLHPRAAAAGAVPLARPGDAVPGWRNWALAASVVLAVTSTTLLWRAETQNAALQARAQELGQPLAGVVTVPVDVMRSASPSTPDVRIRRPLAPTLLVLDVEVAAQLTGASTLDLQLSGPDGNALASGTATPTADGRVEIALHTAVLPDGVLTLRLAAPDSGAVQVRRVELLPAR